MRCFRNENHSSGAGAWRRHRCARGSRLRPRKVGASTADMQEMAAVLGLQVDRHGAAQLARLVASFRQTALERRKSSLDFEHQPAVRLAIVPPPPEMTASNREDERKVLCSGERPADEDLCYADISVLRSLLDSGAVTSRYLTELSLKRLETRGRELHCVAELCHETALLAADRMDAERERGISRGPLHGIPWGAKDLLDTADIPTRWGAEPYRDRIPGRDAATVRALERAGAVLVAKLSMGALAYGDIWYEGTTRNPWKTDSGSSGSSAGSAAAVAAGLVPFALGTETMGSIISPSLVCGTAGLRPTFGRVSRDGCMPLCPSYDKIGPMARTVYDCSLVLEAISGHTDAGAAIDPDCVDARYESPGRDADTGLHGVRVGYPAGQRTDDAEFVFTAAESLGAELVPVTLPDVSYEVLAIPVWAEAAATFEELTESGLDAMLRWQTVAAWPNTFRSVRFLSAVEYIQAQRLRRVYAGYAADAIQHVDVVLAPPAAVNWLYLTNGSGHPSLTFRAGFSEDGMPIGATLYGDYWSEAKLVGIARVLERSLGAADKRPPT